MNAEVRACLAFDVSNLLNMGLYQASAYPSSETTIQMVSQPQPMPTPLRMSEARRLGRRSDHSVLAIERQTLLEGGHKSECRAQLGD